MLNWIKKGKIFDPRERFEWMHEYAQNPNAIILDDRIRVYFSCRPKRGQDGSCTSRIGFVDLDRKNPVNVLYVHDKPVIELGGRGDFDEFGTMPGSILHIKERNEIWLYYVGWTRKESVPYQWANGLAISKDGGITFQKIGKGPIMSVTVNEPYLQACPRVWRFAQNDWRMWYQSGIEWYESDGHLESVYVTMSATSHNGIDWIRNGKQVIPSKVFKESQTSPCILNLDSDYHMLFSYRHGTNFRNPKRGYRIGYAHSHDMLNWVRDDSLCGIDISESGWDSEMLCYPHLLQDRNKIYMFYCGNYFGRDGFGFSELQSN
jgi:hypothetical protein